MCSGFGREGDAMAYSGSFQSNFGRLDGEFEVESTTWVTVLAIVSRDGWPRLKSWTRRVAMQLGFAADDQQNHSIQHVSIGRGNSAD